MGNQPIERTKEKEPLEVVPPPPVVEVRRRVEYASPFIIDLVEMVLLQVPVGFMVRKCSLVCVHWYFVITERLAPKRTLDLRTVFPGQLRKISSTLNVYRFGSLAVPERLMGYLKADQLLHVSGLSFFDGLARSETDEFLKRLPDPLKITSLAAPVNSLSTLLPFKNLERLEIHAMGAYGTILYFPQVSTTSTADTLWRNMPQSITYLDLTGCPDSFKEALHFKNLRVLKCKSRFTFTDTTVTSWGLETLDIRNSGCHINYTILPHLKTLGVGDSTHCRPLAILENLRVLDFSWTKIPIHGLSFLSTLRHLEYFNFTGCKGVDDGVCEQLLSLPNVNQLIFDYCSNLTSDGITKLCHHLPLKFLSILQVPQKHYKWQGVMLGKSCTILYSIEEGGSTYDRRMECWKC